MAQKNRKLFKTKPPSSFLDALGYTLGKDNIQNLQITQMGALTSKERALLFMKHFHFLLREILARVTFVEITCKNQYVDVVA